MSWHVALEMIFQSLKMVSCSFAIASVMSSSVIDESGARMTQEKLFIRLFSRLVVFLGPSMVSGSPTMSWSFLSLVCSSRVFEIIFAWFFPKRKSCSVGILILFIALNKDFWFIYSFGRPLMYAMDVDCLLLIVDVEEELASESYWAVEIFEF